MSSSVPPMQEFELLQQRFIERLPERLARLQTLLQQWLEQGNQQTLLLLHREAHNLTGAAGSYQLARLSHLARELETGLRVAVAGEIVQMTHIRQLLKVVADEVAQLLPRP